MQEIEEVYLNNKGKMFCKLFQDYYEILDDSIFEYEFPKINEINFLTINNIRIPVISIRDYSTALEFVSQSNNFDNCSICILETYNILYMTKLEDLESVVIRIVENIDYSILELFSNNYGIIAYHSFFNKLEENNQEIIKFTNYKLLNNKSVVYRKHTGNIEYVDVVKYPNKKTVAFSDADLISENYELGDTRYFSVHDSNNLISSMSELSPVYKVESLDEYSDLNFKIYKSYSSRKDIENKFSVHGGKGSTDTQSFFSAVGEAIERYSARLFLYDNKYIITDSYKNLNRLGRRILNPIELKLDENFINKYSHCKNFEWIEGYCLTNKEKIFLPANSVFFPYDRPKELMLHSQSTTGISSEVTFSRAVLQGLLEVLERDSYSIVHKARMKVKVIEINECDDKSIKRILKFLNEKDITVHLTLISQFSFVHVVHCTLESKKYPRYTHGSGANLSILVAIKRSIFEAIQLRVSQKELEYLIKDNIEHEEIPSVLWGMGIKEYVSPFLTNIDSEKIKFTSINDLSTGNIILDLQFLVDNLKREGYNVYCANLTRDDVPLYTARVIVPGLQDIDNYNTKVTKRLKNILKEKGKSINTLRMFS